MRMPKGFQKVEYAILENAEDRLILYYDFDEQRMKLFKGELKERPEKWSLIKNYPVGDLKSFVDDVEKNPALRCKDFNSNAFSFDGNHISCENCRFFNEKTKQCDEILKKNG